MQQLLKKAEQLRLKGISLMSGVNQLQQLATTLGVQLTQGDDMSFTFNTPEFTLHCFSKDNTRKFYYEY